MKLHFVTMMSSSSSPIYRWDSTKFKAKVNWDEPASQRAFMDNLAKKLNITNLDGWYTVQAKTIEQHGGYGLLHKYSNSPRKLITTVYPEYLCPITCLYPLLYHWDLSKFRFRVATGHWNTTANQRTFMDNLAKKLNITDQEGWYKITVRSLRSNDAGGLLKRYNDSPFKLLSKLYTEYPKQNVAFISQVHVGCSTVENSDSIGKKTERILEEDGKSTQFHAAVGNQTWYHIY